MDTSTVAVVLCGLLIVVPLVVLVVIVVKTRPKRFPLDKNGPERLEISSRRPGFTFRLDGNPTGHCTLMIAQSGHSMRLQDGSTLNVQWQPFQGRWNWLIDPIVDESDYEWNDKVCWFCEKRESESTMAANITMCKEPHQTANSVVPRCPICKSNHDKIEEMREEAQLTRRKLALSSLGLLFLLFFFLLFWISHEIVLSLVSSFLLSLFLSVIPLGMHSQASKRSIQQFIASHDSKPDSATGPETWKLIANGWRPRTEAMEFDLGCIHSAFSSTETLGNTTRITTHYEYVSTRFFYLSREFAVMCNDCHKLVTITEKRTQNRNLTMPRIKDDPGNGTRFGHAIFTPQQK